MKNFDLLIDCILRKLSVCIYIRMLVWLICKKLNIFEFTGKIPFLERKQVFAGKFIFDYHPPIKNTLL